MAGGGDEVRIAYRSGWARKNRKRLRLLLRLPRRPATRASAMATMAGQRPYSK